MKRIRSLILILGLLAVAFLNIQAGLVFHKDLAHPVGNNAVAIYKAVSESKAPAIVVHARDPVKNEMIETDQTVNVYLFYDYERQEITRLIQSVLIVIMATFILYFSTYVVARIVPKLA
ncbi:hypothetical protein BJL95_02800 [Methylomonas sp. LWB]|uniref:hypothetical protein n=1 Tax=Methylomonas sp. LWB TaxID=1905845 RepID=UPI0008D9ED2C|nr:hypothetical protein [Methylomonas sp. LWB]OHX35986.1 hypothetical protein BJL95_02800 [Methylomonas sp. LWB]